MQSIYILIRMSFIASEGMNFPSVLYSWKSDALRLRE